MQTVVVAGASLGGLRAAEQLRTHGFSGRVVVVGEERWMPYQRPPLSKQALLSGTTGTSSRVEAEALASSLALRPRSSASDVEWRLGVRVMSADLDARTVTLSDGTTLRYDGLVAATGLRPRRLPQQLPALGRHVVRTVDDVVAMRRDLRPGLRVVVVGGGFVGCEVASTLDALGCEVTLVEPLAVPLVRGVGLEIGAALLRHHRACGVRFVVGMGVDELLGRDGRVTGALLDDGSVLDADLVVESVGSTANVEWLEGNGLDLSDGLLCDHGLRVEGRSDVVAVGDVARFPNARVDDVPRRVEHWAVPTETARRAAATLAAHLSGADEPVPPFDPVLSFWSDQFGLHLQSFGAPSSADAVDVLEGHLDRLEDGVVVEYRRGGAVVGVVLVNVPVSRHAQLRSHVTHDPQLV